MAVVRSGTRVGRHDGEGAAALIRVCDLAGRPRGTGFLADLGGTLVTSHEAVDGLARLVLHAPGEQVCLVEAEAVVALPAYGLALVATEGLDARPLPIAPAGSAGPVGPAHPERRAVLRLPHRVEATVLGGTSATYTATDRFHLIDEVCELALGGADLTGAGPRASGTPVVDAATGAVLAVVVTALHAKHHADGLAVPLHAAGASGPLAELIARNAEDVPAYGPHLNLAGALRLTGTSAASACARPAPWREPVARPRTAAALGDFLARRGEEAPLVLGLVGDPGTGRSTELAALAARRGGAPRPAPTLLLRGAELRPGDGSVKDAVERALRTAARLVGAEAHAPDEPLYAPLAYGMADPTAAVAALARTSGRPLAVLLDCPEEMPPVLAHELAGWTAATASWLRTSRVRLVVACRPEFWEQMGALLPADLVCAPHPSGSSRPAGLSRPPGLPEAAADGAEGEPGSPVRPLPPCMRLGDLAGKEAAEARERHGLPQSALRAPDAGHPLTLRLLSQLREELGASVPEGAPPSRTEIFTAHLDAVSLRIAVRLGAGSPTAPAVAGSALRRLAARVAGRAHEAARRCLGPGQGELEREAFEELFPWRTGWASAVLAEGLLVPAGAGYRFAHEEFGDWMQSLHLDLPTALHALVHRWSAPPGRPVPPAPPGDAPVRLPSRPARRSGTGRGGPSRGRAGKTPPVPPAPPVGPAGHPRSLPVPRHRAGPVVGALLLAPPDTLAAHLTALVRVLDDGQAGTQGTVPALLPAPRAVGVPPQGAADAGAPPNRRTGRAASAARTAVQPAGPVEPPAAARRRADAQWWAAHLLRETLLRVEDAGPYHAVLRELAARIVVRAVAESGFAPERLGALREFGPWFWEAIPLAVPDRLALLRLLLPADGPPAAGPFPVGPPAGGQPVATSVAEGSSADRYPADRSSAGRVLDGGSAAGWSSGGGGPAGGSFTGGPPAGGQLAAASVAEGSSADRYPADRSSAGPVLDGGSVAGWRSGGGVPADGPPAGVPLVGGQGVAASPAEAATVDAPAGDRMSGGQARGGGPVAEQPSGGGSPARVPPVGGQSAATSAADGLPAGGLPADRSVPDRPSVNRWSAGRALGGAAPAGGHEERFLQVVSRVVREHAGQAVPVVCGWLDDDRPLQGAHPATAGTRLTVACAAQALLHTHRLRAPDVLTETLVTASHPEADALLVALAEDQPDAICRAVDRWAHDPRPQRRVAAATYAALVAPFVRGAADRELLRYAALALLARADERALHGPALGVLVRDPRTRVRYLPAALRGFATGGPAPTPEALAAALGTHPEMVLHAFRDRLRTAGRGTAEVLAALAAVEEPGLDRRAAELVRDHLARHPESAPDVARYLDRRLEQARARPLLRTLAVELMRDQPASVRAALLPVLAAPGTRLSRPLRHELLDTALATERDPDVLAALLGAAARSAPVQHPLLTRDLVHRLAILLTRTPRGAARFDRTVVTLAAGHPPFARLLRGWLADTTWDTLLGPSARYDVLTRGGGTPVEQAVRGERVGTTG